LYLQAGLLACSALAPSHSVKHETVAEIAKTYAVLLALLHSKHTATGIAPDFNRIPF
jgi:hypothetical protein